MTNAEINYVATAIHKELDDEMTKRVPSWAKGMIPSDLVPHLSAVCATIAIKSLDTFRSTQGK